MPANNRATEFMSGRLYWSKVLGDPVPNYGGDAREWTFEFEPDAEGVKLLKKHKLADRLKDKENPDRKVLRLKKPEFNRDGVPNKPIRIYDEDDNEWSHDKLIGNASGADVKLDIRDYGPGKKAGIYPVAIRITDHVPYTSSEFGGMAQKEGAPKKQLKVEAPDFNKDFGLDDDVDDVL